MELIIAVKVAVCSHLLILRILLLLKLSVDVCPKARSVPVTIVRTCSDLLCWLRLMLSSLLPVFLLFFGLLFKEVLELEFACYHFLLAPIVLSLFSIAVKSGVGLERSLNWVSDCRHGLIAAHCAWPGRFVVSATRLLHNLFFRIVCIVWWRFHQGWKTWARLSWRR